MGETVKYGCLNTIHLMPELCRENQSSFQDPSYLSWLQKTSLHKLLCLTVPSCEIQIIRPKRCFENHNRLYYFINLPNVQIYTRIFQK